jgi:NTE family protein
MLPCNILASAVSGSFQATGHHKGYEGHAKDYEFSGTSMREHWEMGLEDTERTLRHRQWLMLPTNVEGVAIHDLHREDPA